MRLLSGVMLTLCASTVRQTTKDLEELDRQRREDFKKYEMEKEFKYQEELQTLDEEHKKEAVKKHEEELKKKKEHPKVRIVSGARAAS